MDAPLQQLGLPTALDHLHSGRDVSWRFGAGSVPAGARTRHAPLPDRLRIALLVPRTDICGGARILFEHADRLAARGHTVTVLSYFPRPDWFDLQAPFVQVPTGTRLVDRAPVVDVVVCGYWSLLPEAVAAQLAPVVHFEQGDYHLFEDITPEVRARVAACLDLADAHTVVSSTVSAVMRERFGTSASVVPNAVDPAVFHPGDPVARARRSVLCVGWDGNAFKGVEDMRAAARSLRTSHPDVDVVWVTPSAPEGPHDEFARVVVAPSRSELADLYRSASAYACASRYESFPLPPMEAMASGTPVVTTANTGSLEYCVDEVNSLVVPLRDPAALHRALSRVLDDGDLAARLVTGGIATSGSYTWDAVMDTAELAYRRCAEAGAPLGPGHWQEHPVGVPVDAAGAERLDVVMRRSGAQRVWVPVQATAPDGGELVRWTVAASRTDGRGDCRVLAPHRVDGHDPVAWSRGADLLQAGRPTEALAALEEAAARAETPEDLLAVARRVALCHLAAEDPVAAVAALVPLVVDFPDHADLLVLLAAAAVDAGLDVDVERVEELVAVAGAGHRYREHSANPHDLLRGLLAGADHPARPTPVEPRPAQASAPLSRSGEEATAQSARPPQETPVLETAIPAPRRPHLVVVRVGDSSLHPTWIQGERSFDLVVDYYGDTPGRWDGTADLVLESKGSKWQGLHALLSAHPHLLSDYDAVWFPDDDIATDAATISAAFALHTELGLGLSQPALTADSYFTHLVTLAHPGLAVRVTNFVEVMVPMFSREALAACFDTFAESRSGYGLDLVWQALLPGLGLRSAVFDCLTVRHTRPLGSGSLYQGMAETPAVEGARVAKAHGMPTPVASEVHEVLTADGTHLTGADAEELVLDHLPIPTVQEVPSWDLYSAFLRQRSERRASGPRVPAEVARPREGRAVAAAAAPVDWHGGADGPVVLVAGSPGAAERAETWRVAGWQVVTVQLPAAGGADLGPWLARAEQHPVRALDVVDDDSDALERAVTRGVAAGAVVIVRATPRAVRCHHGLSAEALAFTGRCEACAFQWRSIGAGSAAVVVDSGLLDTVRGLAPEAPVVTELPDAADLAEVATLAGLPAVDPMTVVVLDRPDAAPGSTATTTTSLLHQRGLTGTCHVLVVDAGSDPADLARAASAAQHDRVLVLAAGDVAGPWCVADHRRAAAAEADRRGGGSSGGAVVSGARPSLLRAEDVYETALQSSGAGIRPGDRASLPAAALAGLASGVGLGSALDVAAVVQRLSDPVRLPGATHEATRREGLDAERDTVVTAALTAGVVGGPAADRGASLVHWSHVGPETALVLAELLTADEPSLRWSVMGLATGERATDLVSAAVAGDLDAHSAAADEAVRAVRGAVAAARPWLLAADAGDDRLVPLLADADRLVRAGELDPTAFRVVVVVDRSGPLGDEQAVARHLAGRLGALGAPVSALAVVDVVASTAPARRWLDADVALPVLGEAWYRGLPVPLLALDPATWLGHLDVVALAARAEAAAAAPSPALRLPTQQTRPAFAGASA